MKLFKRRVAAEACVPPDQRVYAVGDVHGRIDLLDAVLDRIDDDLARHPHPEATLVFLGDYVDRGPYSASVIERLIEVCATYRAVCLRGNHEAMLCDFLERPSTLPAWGAVGGIATLQAYGLTPSLKSSPDDCRLLAEQLHWHMPEGHHSFLAGLALFHTAGDYVFVHAGLRPKVALDLQVEQDLLWIREDFILYEGRHEKFVVHGHTPVIAPDVRPNRINIDTGAFATGRLTCLVLEGADRRFV